MTDSLQYVRHSLTASRLMLRALVADLKPEDFLHQPIPGGNCAAWVIGHLGLVCRNLAGRLGVTELPTLPVADMEARFRVTGQAAPTPSDLGDPAALVQFFDASVDALLAGLAKAPPELLTGPAPFRAPMFATLGEAVNFSGHHITFHAGQISMIRRSLGRPPLF